MNTTSASFIGTTYHVTVAEVVAQDTVTNLASDTTIVPGTMPAGYPGYAPMMVPGYPGVPQGYPVMPGYAQPPMGYPQQYPQYPPGYGQPVYPNMGYPMGMPAAPGYAMPAVVEPDPVPVVTEAAVRLPPPESTGFKQALAPVVVPAGPSEAGTAPKTEEKPSTSAADIIKQYMNKRK